MRISSADPEGAEGLRELYQLRKERFKGIVKNLLEDWCNCQGLHVPTAQEREAEAIARILDLEGTLA